MRINFTILTLLALLSLPPALLAQEGTDQEDERGCETSTSGSGTGFGTSSGECTCIRRSDRRPYVYQPGKDCDHDDLENWEEDRDGDCQVDPGETAWNDADKDTDGDGIHDLFESWTSRQAHRAYIQYYRVAHDAVACNTNPGNFPYEEQYQSFERALLRGDRCRYTLLDTNLATNPWDCDGDGNHNGNEPSTDADSDGDGITDADENCSGNIEGSHTDGYFPGCVRDTRLRFKNNPYFWQETDPYNSDTDGDGLPDGQMVVDGQLRDADLCPRDITGGDRRTHNFECVRRLCRTPQGTGEPGTIGKLTAFGLVNFDTDGDQFPDIKEDVDGDCVVDRQTINDGGVEAIVSKESDPYYEHSDAWDPVTRSYPDAPTGDYPFGIGDAINDKEDGCPLDSNLRCLYVCVPLEGPWHPGHQTAPDRTLAVYDYDDDDIPDGIEDKSRDCIYNAPAAGTVTDETNWRDPDTDGDFDDWVQMTARNDPRFKGTGLDNVDKCPHFAPVSPDERPEGMGETERRRTEYPGCAFHYCVSRNPNLKVPEQARFEVVVPGGSVQQVDTDGDGIYDHVENPSRDCQAGSFPLDTDPLNPDSDGDGIVDGDDFCPHIATPDEPDFFDCPDICPENFQHPRWVGLDSDGDGLKNDQEDINSDCDFRGPFESDPFDTDTDDDSFTDYYDACGNTKHALWKDLDSDNDGLLNKQEDVDTNCQRGFFESDPFDPDTDNDMIKDFSDACAFDPSPNCLQVCRPATSFQDAQRDSDGDGLKDVEEDSDKDCLFFGVLVAMGGAEEEFADPFDSSPYLRDSDDDGIGDRVDGCQGEVIVSPDIISNPVATREEMDCARDQCLRQVGRLPGLLKDSDRDGIPDVTEDKDSDCKLSVGAGGVGVSLETDRFNPDTDGDNLPDGVEDMNHNGLFEPDKGETDPRTDDTDKDGIPDGLADLNGDGVFDTGEDRNLNGRVDFGELDPRKLDTDGDGIPDNIEDRNMNGLWDGGQTSATGPCRNTGNNGLPETSGYIKDSDLDGVPDNIEDRNMNGIFTSIGGRDFDGNYEGTITEFGEYFPCNADSDADGLLDGQEDRVPDGVLDFKGGETSPISPNTFGEPDVSRNLRKIGQGGCSLIR